jgi:hypothetical protein
MKIAVGRAVAQEISRWLPTAAAWVRNRAACGVCGGQSGTGAGFFRVLRFLLSIIPPISPSSQSPGAGTINLLVAAVPSGPNWTPPPTIPIQLKNSSRWEDNNKTNSVQIRFDVDWINLAQNRDQWRCIMNTLVNLWVA